MKLFGGERLGGGKASRAEVYGLFIAAIVLTGGGIGGAYAISASLGSSEQTITDAPQDSNEETTSNAPQDSNEETTSDAPQDSIQAPSPAPSGQPTPSSSPPVAVPGPGDETPASPENGLIKEPYIGPADTFSYLSRGHICGWDTQALGGFGWGFDPTEPCNSLFVEYVGKHCEAADGVVYFQRCEEYFSRTLPVAY
jgi:hypothetical protein